jgi:hypothetical protein
MTVPCGLLYLNIRCVIIGVNNVEFAYIFFEDPHYSSSEVTRSGSSRNRHTFLSAGHLLLGVQCAHPSSPLMLAIHRAVYLTSLLSGAPFLLRTTACNSADRNKDVLPFSPFNGGAGVAKPGGD